MNHLVKNYDLGVKFTIFFCNFTFLIKFTKINYIKKESCKKKIPAAGAPEMNHKIKFLFSKIAFPYFSCQFYNFLLLKIRKTVQGGVQT